MFVANPTNKEALLSSWSKLLPAKKLAQLQKSKGYHFYEEIFSKIEEEDFSVLYSKKHSGANSAVNCLVGAFLLCHHRNWSHEELDYQLSFNIEARVAVGLKDLEEVPFVMRTFYNFLNRLTTYHKETGKNLLQGVFDKLTTSQLEKLGIKTNIQRTDSVLLNSSIRSYSRLALLVEVISRLYKVLSPADQSRYDSILKPYLVGGEKYVYSINGSDRVTKLEYLAIVYYKLYTNLQATYAAEPLFQIFERVYQEHFKAVAVSSESVHIVPLELRDKTELSSGTLQSPDDLEATYRTKRKTAYQGYVGLGVETCHPDNGINLVTQVDVAPNNIDDSVLLTRNIDQIIEKTPDIEELHQDGGFGCQQMDQKAEENGIILVQTAVKGRDAQVPFSIEGTVEQGFEVSCPNEEQPSVKAEKAKKNYKADFDLATCQTCPFKDNCPAFKGQNAKQTFAVFRFTLEDSQRQKRNKSIQKIPDERKTIRSGVENLMGRMHRGEKHTGKLRVRGLFKCQLYGIAMGIVVNFERIFSYLYA